MIAINLTVFEYPTVDGVFWLHVLRKPVLNSARGEFPNVLDVGANLFQLYGCQIKIHPL